jgi:ParB-like chromosome segregation protein Spo0J
MTTKHEAVIGRFDALRVDPRKLRVKDGYNVRDLDAAANRVSLDVLKESIREKGGVMTPLRVRAVAGETYIVEGHRRHKVVMELIGEGMEIESVPAIMEERYIDDAERTLGLILSNSGEPLSEPEKAEVVRRLFNMGWSREKVQARLGYKTPQTIANFELWLSAPAEIKEAVRAGEVAYSTAVEITRKSDGDETKATETLQQARKTAKESGRKRVTGRSLPNEPKRGKRSAAAVETATAAKLARQDADKGAAPSYQVEKALALLSEAMTANYTPEVAAKSYVALSASRVARIAEWLMELEDHLRHKEDDAFKPTSGGLPASATT